MSLLPAPSEWSPLEEQFHTWDIILLNPSVFGTVPMTRALGQWASISITESTEGIRTSVEINAEEPSIPFIRELITDFLFYRDHRLLYRLRVVDSEDTLTRDAATVKFDCVSYEKLLERRILHEDWILDDRDIDAAWRLIAYTQAKQTLGITRGTTTPGVRRQRGLDAGDDILTAINDFAQADGGFDWWIDQNLRFWAAKPRRGKHHDFLWQLGGEIGEMTRVNPIEDYASLIMATGAQQETRIPRDDGTEDVYQPPDPQIVQLTTKPLGLWEYTTSDTDVITEASLVEKANWHLADKGTIRPTYKVVLEPGVWSPEVALGDVFTARISSVRVAVRVPVRIEELQINCTADGAETIALSVRAEEPETPEVPIIDPLPQALSRATLAPAGAPNPNGRTVQRHRLTAADDLGALLRSLRKRLDRAERSPGIGGGGGNNILDGIGPPPPTVGSPGDYYVDTFDQELYGPKSDSEAIWPASVHWTSANPANAVRTGILGGQLGIAQRPLNIVGFRYGGTATASDPITITIWEYWTSTVLYRTTGPGTGSDGFIEIPPIHFEPDGRWAVTLGGASIPVHEPGGTYPTGVPDWVYLISPEGLYTTPPSGPVGPADNSTWTWDSTACLDLELMVQLDAPYIAAPQECASLNGWPDANLTGELGVNVYVNERGRLLGWRYRKLASSSPTLVWNVWTTEYRYFNPVYANVKQFPLELLTTITTNDDGEGEFDVLLPEPILIDPLDTRSNRLMISVGAEAVPYGPQPVWTDRPDWYNAFFDYGYYNPTIGQFPQDMIPGGTGYEDYRAPYISPIMQQELELWPLTNTARSGSVYDANPERVELHRNMAESFSGDAQGLRFYDGGPSHDETAWQPGEGVPWFSAALKYGGYSGMEFTPDDWYDESGHTVPPDPVTYTNKYAYYNWYYDYAYDEQDADLDPNDQYWPGSWYMYFQDHGVWDDDAYWSTSTYGPRHGAAVDGEDSDTPTRGGAGFHCEVSGVGPMTAGDSTANETTALAHMHAFTDDGIHGTQLTVTPRVIQACFPPDGVRDTWWYGDGSAHQGLTPKGCVVPLVTAASATATAADEPWQKQFFRQIGVNTVTFTDGVGTIPVPIGMGLPAVVNAQVDGVTAGGTRVAQAQRTADNAITVALDTTYDGDLAINWSVDAAVITFGTPPPSIDTIRNPGSSYLYGARVEYDPAGGAWPFELVSWGNTFQNGCVLKDFTGATVGGPFTPESISLTGDIYYQRILWDAGRDWYLPGQTQQYRMTNPDGQVSAWNVISWYDDGTLMAVEAAASRVAAMMSPDTAAAEDTPEGPRNPPWRYANNPRLQPQVAPFVQPAVEGLALAADSVPEGRGPDDPLDRGPRLGNGARDVRGGKERYLARQERQRQERLAKQQTEEPPPETTGQ